MHIQAKSYYAAYERAIGKTLAADYAAFDFDAARLDLGYQTAASAVFSSNIEGNSIDLNSFMNMRLAGQRFMPHKEVEEIENLIAAYELAQQTSLTEAALLQAHDILAQTLLPSALRGAYRQTQTGVFSTTGLVYLAVEPQFVEREMTAFFAEVEALLPSDLSLTEIFYFAALLHLRFVHIHPFVDGNGRAARLLEKWFLARHLGLNGWKIPAEKYYQAQRAAYYDHLNLGVNFYELDYDGCLPFLLMLPQALRQIGQ